MPENTKYREASVQQLALWEWLGRRKAAETLAVQHWSSRHPGQPIISEMVIPAIRGPVMQSAEEQARILRTFLLKGAPYYWNKEMCDLLHTAAGKLPLDLTLKGSMFPSVYGYMWFEEPIPIPVMPEVRIYSQAPRADWLRGFFWFPYLHDKTKRREISFYPQDFMETDNKEYGFFFTFIVEDPDIRAGGVVQGSLPILFRQSIGDAMTEAIHEIQYDQHPDRAQGVARTTAKFQHAFAALLLTQMPVIKRVRHSVGRDERHLWERTPEQPQEVEVVYLRRYQYVNDEAPAEPGAVDWSCRWWVGVENGGFWRTYHRGQPEEFTRWIMPFIKGPANKPVKAPSSKLFAVVR